MMEEQIDSQQQEFIQELIFRGDYQFTLEILEDYEKKSNLTSTDDIILLLFKCKILNILGFYNKAFELAKIVLTKSQEAKMKNFEIDSLFQLIASLNHLGKLEESRNYLIKCAKIIESLAKDSKSILKIAHLAMQKGIQSKLSGNLESAIKFFDKSFFLFSKYGAKYDLAEILSNQGLVFATIGDLDKSMILLAQGLAIYQQLENRYKIADTLNNLGGICRQKGFSNQALRHFKQSLAIWEDIGNKEAIARSLSDIGTIYKSTGEFKKALLNFNLSLKIYREIGNFINLAEILYNIILLNLVQNKTSEAEELLVELNEINTLHPHKPTNQLLRVAKALVLKKSSRFRNVIKATELLEGVIAEDVMNYEVMVEALLNLCELYLVEFKTTKEEEAMRELKHAVNTLFEIAGKQKSQKLFSTAYWLKAHISMIELDIDMSKELLSKAQNIAEEMGLQNIAIKISNDYDQLLNKSEDWNRLKKENASISERLELAQVDELLSDLLQQGIKEISDLPREQPVFLTILDKNGSSIYSREFGEKSDIDDQLIGGFLTALNSFLSEAFSTSGSIDRIKYKEFTFVMKPSDDIIFCYIFKGHSYYAIQKLETFVNNVKETPNVWEIFDYFVKTGIISDDRFRDPLNTISDNTFLSKTP